MPTPEPYRELMANLNVTVACRHSCFDAATDPATIFSVQCDDVSRAVREFGQDDPAILSDMLSLPLWSVRRCLVELGLGHPVPQRAKYSKRATALQKVIALMKDGRERTCQMIAKCLGCGPHHVATTIRDNPGVFVRHLIVDPNSQEQVKWTLVKGEK